MIFFITQAQDVSMNGISFLYLSYVRWIGLLVLGMNITNAGTLHAPIVHVSYSIISMSGLNRVNRLNRKILNQIESFKLFKSFKSLTILNWYIGKSLMILKSVYR